MNKKVYCLPTSYSLEELEEKYNYEHNMFDDPIQINYVDFTLLRWIDFLIKRTEYLQEQIDRLTGN